MKIYLRSSRGDEHDRTDKLLESWTREKDARRGARGGRVGEGEWMSIRFAYATGKSRARRYLRGRIFVPGLSKNSRRNLIATFRTHTLLARCVCN